MDHFTKWCLSNQVDFRALPVKSIADFILYLFQERKLQPSTIDGNRSAIADKLGNSPINVSKDENLTCLLDSFHRERPKGQRDIPSWNLSLVSHQLTKASFEPIKEASLKHLILGSMLGKTRTSDTSQTFQMCLCTQRPAFFPRTSRPRRVQTVVKPALAPTLDKFLKSDRSLCPVRALRYYLDRTSGRTRSWSLSSLSYLLMDQTDCDHML